MREKLVQIKQHIVENKWAYISGGVGLAAGAAGAVILTPKITLANTRQFQILTWKSKQTVEIFVEALGDPGNIIQDTTTGIVYASQGQAARELGVSPARISENLTGKLPNVKGHIFKKLGKASVSD